MKFFSIFAIVIVAVAMVNALPRFEEEDVPSEQFTALRAKTQQIMEPFKQNFLSVFGRLPIFGKLYEEISTKVFDAVKTLPNQFSSIVSQPFSLLESSFSPLLGGASGTAQKSTPFGSEQVQRGANSYSQGGSRGSSSQKSGVGALFDF